MVERFFFLACTEASRATVRILDRPATGPKAITVASLSVVGLG